MENDLSYLYHVINGLETKFKKRLIIELGERLAATIGKEPAWDYKTLDNVIHNRKPPTDELLTAIRQYGAVVDGQNLLIAKSHLNEVYTLNGNVERGAFIFHKSKRCANPECQLPFVPNVPWRTHCQVCRPPRGKR
jgi:hypothetical protein